MISHSHRSRWRKWLECKRILSSFWISIGICPWMRLDDLCPFYRLIHECEACRNAMELRQAWSNYDLMLICWSLYLWPINKQTTFKTWLRHFNNPEALSWNTILSAIQALLKTNQNIVARQTKNAPTKITAHKIAALNWLNREKQTHKSRQIW